MRPGSMNGFGYVEGNQVNATGPSGKVMWGWVSGQGYEEQDVEWAYEWKDYLHWQLEYPIRQSGPGRDPHPDLILMSDSSPDAFGFGYVYEIEPWIAKENGLPQVLGYVDRLNAAARAGSLIEVVPANQPMVGGRTYNWNDIKFKLGPQRKIGPIELQGPYYLSFRLESTARPIAPWPLILHAESTEDGVIAWWYEIDKSSPIVLAKLPESLAKWKRYIRERDVPTLQPAPVPAYARNQSEDSWSMILVLLAQACADWAESNPWVLVFGF
jgi:hypothetical protein